MEHNVILKNRDNELVELLQIITGCRFFKENEFYEFYPVAVIKYADGSIGTEDLSSVILLDSKNSYLNETNSFIFFLEKISLALNTDLAHH